MKKDFFIIFAVVAVAAALIVAGCAQTPSQQPLPQENKTAECLTSSDCGVGGCSGQVCTTAAEAKGLITTCEYRAEYDCLKLTSCGCVEGKCAWQQDAEYSACLDKAKSQPQQLQ